MSRERPANTKETAKQASPMPIKGNLKTTNAKNPTLHTKKDASNLSSKVQGGQKGPQLTHGKEGQKSSITFGQIRFDQSTHMLYADAKKGGDQIRCSISQDALCECFDAKPTSNDLQNCFTQHKGEILKALEQKWLAGKWKTPNKEICLEEMDIRRHLEE